MVQLAGFLLAYVAFLFAFAWFHGMGERLLGNAVVWGFSMACIYCIYIVRLSIRIDGETLVYKKTNGIGLTRLPINGIKSVEVRRGLLYDKVVIGTHEDKRVTLYPQNPTDFVAALAAHGYSDNSSDGRGVAMAGV